MARTVRVKAVKNSYGRVCFIIVRPSRLFRHNCTSLRTVKRSWADGFCCCRSKWMDFLFSGVQSNNYWSSSTNASNTSNAWIVNFNNGNVNSNDKTNSNYVLPVRGGE